MGRTNRQARHCKANRQKQLTTTCTILKNTLQFCFSVLISGQSYWQFAIALLHNNILPPPESTFYRCQRMVFTVIKDVAIESMAHQRSILPFNSGLGFDGSWSHRRNARQCVISLINTFSRKIVDIEILEMSAKGTEGNYNGASRNMEREGVLRLLKRWGDETWFTIYIHDNDASTRKLMRDTCPSIREYIDPNHMIKTLDRLFNQYNKKKELNGL